MNKILRLIIAFLFLNGIFGYKIFYLVDLLILLRKLINFYDVHANLLVRYVPVMTSRNLTKNNPFF